MNGSGDSKQARIELYQRMNRQHGGFWREQFVDHNYLYNLYFPPQAFYHSIQANLEALVQNYPMSQHVLAGHLSSLVDLPVDYLCVANGAAELVRIIATQLSSKLIVPIPSFNEYANAAGSARVVEFELGADFELDVGRYFLAAKRCKADTAIIVTPNNPTSLIVPREEVLWLAEKLASMSCTLLVDESFIDFCDHPQSNSISSDLVRHTNLVLLKSLSKAYGICGLRLGYLATANKAYLSKLKHHLPIWNINSFAEEFLVKSPQYLDAFRKSCELVRRDREDFYKALNSIPGLTVWPPQANFVFCKLPENTASAPELAQKLFVEHGIFIKSCDGKSLPKSERYVRLASRTQQENQRLVELLRQFFKH